MKQIVLILLILSSLSSCISREERVQKTLQKTWKFSLKEDFNKTKAIDVFVVTNRQSNLKGFGCSKDRFGIGFSSDLRFGLCQINVPRNHDVGKIELAKDDNDSSHDFFKVVGAKSMQQQDLIKSIKSSGRTPLVFVHGFNVRYQEAVLRASQIAYDLKYQGPVILFTWPAGSKDGFFQEKMMGKIYENNLLNARATKDIFEKFLLDLQKSDMKVNLAVHSMGHQIVLPALNSLGKKSFNKVFINQLILNAPDFDSEKFKTIAKNVKSISKRVTLYCSHNDKAIIASKAFNHNERAGSCVNVKNIDVINAGLIDDTTFGLGHGYYSSRAIIGDVFQTFLEIDVSKRLFIKKGEANGKEQYFLRR